MRHIAAFFVVVILICFSAVFLNAQAPAQKPPDTVLEKPGLFRISLPPGWQRTDTTADAKVIAAFSKGDLRAKVIRYISAVPAEDFARSVTSRTPPESNRRLDEYLQWGGLPSQRTEYWDCAAPANGTEHKENCEEVRTIFTLSPGEYWALEIRGFKDPDAEHDSGFAYTFELLESTRSRVRALIPEAAWDRMPRFAGQYLLGMSSGIGFSGFTVDAYSLHSRGERPRPQSASTLALIGQEILKKKCYHGCERGDESYVLQHYVGNLSAGEFAEYVQNEQKQQKGVSYYRNEIVQGKVEGLPATGIVSTRRRKKDRGVQIVVAVTVSRGIDHFAVQRVIAPICEQSDEEDSNWDDLCYGSAYHPDFNEARLFALYPPIAAVSSAPRESAGLPNEVALEQRTNGMVLKFLAATSAGDLAWARAVLEENPDLLLAGNIRVGEMTPLHIAARDGNTELLKLLLRYHADVNATSNDGWTPLHSAAFSGKKESVELLLASKADVNSKSSGGETPLLQAAQQGYTDVVELLLAGKADVNSKSSSGETPLLQAVQKGHTDVVKLLLARGAGVSAKGSDGCTPLHRAAFSGNDAATKLLLAYKAEVDARSLKGQTPLWQAAMQGHTDVAELLLARGADINAKDNDGSTPLDIAAFGRSKGMVELLIRHNADVNGRDNSGWTPLHEAVLHGDKDLAEVLLAHKADANAGLAEGMTPLDSAAKHGYKDVAEMLIEHNAAVNAKDKDGWTPLTWAAVSGHADVAKLLLAHNADVNARDNDGGTPLSNAVIKGHKDVAELLLAHGADVNVKDIYGNTALHLADSVDMAELLIAHGADVNARNRKGFTPLAEARARHDANLVRLLQQHGGQK